MRLGVRLPRFLGKKRGHRRTGSQVWGTLGDGAFHAILLLTGLAFAALLATGVAVPEWRINHDFMGTRCTILGKGLVRKTVEDPPGAFSNTWQPCLLVRYDVDGVSRVVWSRPGPGDPPSHRAAALERLGDWKLGAQVPGWYDPSEPATVVLERGYNWRTWLLALLLPGSLAAFGAAGLRRSLTRWGRSEEYRASVGSQPAVLVGLGAGTPAATRLPAVPPCDDLINSPGTILRYRLPIESPESWKLLGLGIFAVIWNAVLIVLAVGVGMDLLGGRGNVMPLFLLVPFAIVGIGACGLFIRAMVLTTAVGTTQVEISDHPLRPGGRYELLLAQSGTGAFPAIEVTLALEEQATFRQGTDTRTEKIIVWQRHVHSWQDVQMTPGTRFEGRLHVDIPAEAMHSFTSEHNLVRWKLVVRGTPVRWPRFERTFPLVVFPPDSSPVGVSQRVGQDEAS